VSLRDPAYDEHLNDDLRSCFADAPGKEQR
jgi:hypothetical protein